MLKLMKSLSRDQKKYIIVALDCILIPLSLWFAFNLQMSSQAAWNTLLGYLPVLPYLLIISGFLSIWIGVASVQLKSYEGGAIGQSAIFAWALASVMALLSYMIGLPLSIETHIVFGFSFFVFSVISRAVLLQVVLAIYRSSPHRCRVLIYGAGTTGMQLVSALRGHEEIEAVAFVDDNSALHGLTVSRLQVYTPMQIPELIEDKQVDRVVLAVPSLSPPKQAQIARKLQGLGIEVQTLPSFSQLIGEEELINKLTTLSPNSFLGRDEVAEALGENRNAYRNRSVLISGAGGSIGSELCRQVLDCRPAKLILF
ncbi:MAG: polysaccharide biosynthesis protein, partial [Pseudomonadota bacterium]